MFHWSITDLYVEYKYGINTTGKTLHFIPATLTQYDATFSAFIDLQGISPNDGEYSVTWRHRFSDENNAVVLDRMLAALSPNWIFKGKDIDIWKANTVRATCVLDMSCNTPQGPALGTLLNNSLTLSFE